MSNPLLRALPLAGLLSALACGGHDGGPSWSSSIDAQSAAIAGTDAGAFADAVAEGLIGWGYSTSLPAAVAGTTAPTPAERLIARVRADGLRRGGRAALAATASPFRASSICTPVETGVDGNGDPIDTDADGIPDDYMVNFGTGCVDSEGDYSMTYSGALRIREVAGLFGYRLDALQFRVRAQHLTEYEQLSTNGMETGTYAASGITHQVQMDFGDSWHYLTLAPMPAAGAPTFGGTGSIRYVVQSNASYAPDGVIAWGSPVPSGALTLDADYQVHYSGSAGSGNWRFTLSAPGLTVDAACGGVTAGTLNGALSGATDTGFRLTWTGCHTFTIETRGTSG